MVNGRMELVDWRDMDIFERKLIWVTNIIDIDSGQNFSGYGNFLDVYSSQLSQDFKWYTSF